jgi:phytoene dehydrogenase-like protein
MLSPVVVFDVVVIGAGYGGVSLAALQAHSGRRVALIDKTPRAGGTHQAVDSGFRVSAMLDADLG